MQLHREHIMHIYIGNLAKWTTEDEIRAFSRTTQVSTMFSDILQAASDARLSPLVSRIAVIVADIASTEQALRFIDSCTLEGEAPRVDLLDGNTLLK